MALDWLPVKPDIVPREGGLKAQFAPFCASAPFDYIPVDFLPQSRVQPMKRKSSHAQWMSFSNWTFQTPAFNHLSWQPDYPDRVQKAKPRLTGHSVVAHYPTIPILAFPIQGVASFGPDILRRKPVRPHGMHVYPIASTLTTPLNSPVMAGFAVSYPSLISRKRMHASGQQAFAIGSFGTISIPTLAWLPRFTDWMPPKKLPPTFFTVNYDPIENPPAPELSWQPMLVDFPLKAQVHVSTLPYAWWNTDTPPELPRGWDVQHQMPVRRPVRPFGDYVRAFDTSSAVAPEAWTGSYPSFIHRSRMNERPSIVNPSWSTAPALSLFSFKPILPDVQYRPHMPGWFTLPIFTSGLNPIADTYDCIKLVDAGVSSPLLLNESITVSAFINGSVTPATEGDFC